MNEKASICAELTNDINLNPGFTFDKNGYSGNGIPLEWKGIGPASTCYCGIFDGKGFLVSGIYSTQGYGLFNQVGHHHDSSSEAHIKNVGITNSYINNAAGALCKNINTVNSTVEGCFTTATVFLEGDNNKAGLVGANYGGIIENCYNEADVFGAVAPASGICSYNNSGLIKNCYNKGTIISLKVVASGISVDNGSGTIENCYNSGTIVGASGVGIAGVCGNVKNCYNFGDITSLGKAVGIGEVYDDNTILDGYYLENTADASFVYMSGDEKIEQGKGLSAEEIVRRMQSSGAFTESNGWKSSPSYDSSIKLPLLGIGQESTSLISKDPGYYAIKLNVSDENGAYLYDIQSTYSLLKRGDSYSAKLQLFPNYRFVEWRDENGNVSNSLQLNAVAYNNAIWTAYVIRTCQVTIDAIGGSVSTTGGTCDVGTIINVTAYPENNDYIFRGWKDSSGNIVSTDLTYSFTVEDDIRLTADFYRPNYYYVWGFANESYGTINIKEEAYKEGSEVTLVATPKDGCRFLGWAEDNIDGKIIETNPIYTFTIERNMNIWAKFEPIRHNVYWIENDSLNFDGMADAEEINPYYFSIASSNPHFKLGKLRTYYRETDSDDWIELYKDDSSDTYAYYTIPNIRSDIYIKAEGVIYSDITAIEDLSTLKVYTQDGSIYVETSNLEEVTIISMNGTILKREQQEGLRSYSLPKGVYIICIGEERMKVRL